MFHWLSRILDWLIPVRVVARQLQQQVKILSESYNLVRQDWDALRFWSDPQSRRMLRDRNELLDEADSYLLAGAGPSMQTTTLKENALMPVSVRERMWELELALEDRGWQRQLALSQTEFSRYGLQQIMLFTRLYFVKNPLIQRGITVSAYYVWSRGYELTTTDDTATEVLLDFIQDNVAELGHIGMMQKHHALYTDGNVYLVFFPDEGTGRLQVRTLDATEIFEIVTDPDDVSRPRYYYRKWMARTFDEQTGIVGTKQEERWYPALGYEDEAVPTIKGIAVETTPVLHIKVGGLKSWLFGLPLAYSAIDWARAYKQFLEDWATLNRALARFAWDVETKGGQQAVEQFQKVLGSTLGVGGTSVETNPPPVAASTFVRGPGTKITPMKTAGATGDPEHGRRLMLMVCAAFGIPETFMGDASTGSLATAQSLDRPTELMFLFFQELWREVFQRIGTYALQWSNKAGAGKLREARAKVKKNGDLSDISISVKFPAILEHDIPQMISAIVQAATLSGFELGGGIDMKTVAMLLMAELGIEDPTAVFDAMYPDYDPQDYAKDTDEPPAGTAPAHGHLVQPSFGAEAARLSEAISQLIRASKKMAERAA